MFHKCEGGYEAALCFCILIHRHCIQMFDILLCEFSFLSYSLPDMKFLSHKSQKSDYHYFNFFNITLIILLL